MKWIRQVMMVTAALAVPVSAQAADWWLIMGKPNNSEVLFADADSVVRHSAHATVRIQRIEKSGQPIGAVAHVQCSPPPSAQEDNPLRRFACSTEYERMHLGIMLGDRTPHQTARMIFAMQAGN